MSRQNRNHCSSGSGQQWEDSTLQRHSVETHYTQTSVLAQRYAHTKNLCKLFIFHEFIILLKRAHSKGDGVLPKGVVCFVVEIFPWEHWLLLCWVAKQHLAQIKYRQAQLWWMCSGHMWKMWHCLSSGFVCVVLCPERRWLFAILFTDLKWQMFWGCLWLVGTI